MQTSICKHKRFHKFAIWPWASAFPMPTMCISNFIYSDTLDSGTHIHSFIEEFLFCMTTINRVKQLALIHESFVFAYEEPDIAILTVDISFLFSVLGIFTTGA